MKPLWHVLALTTLLVGPAAAAAATPSFDCRQVPPGSIPARVCGDEALAALDRSMAATYAAASKIALRQKPSTLAAEQRGWLKGRDDCWKAPEPRACVEEAYRRRIAELQASYRLVAFTGPVAWACDGNPANELVVHLFSTEPPTLVAERGDSVSLMFQAPAASGSRYVGRNEFFWEHQGEARVQWGYGAPEMRCVKKP